MSSTVLPYPDITPIPNDEPVAAPSLWNARYTEISQNFKALDTGLSEKGAVIDQLITLTEQMKADLEQKMNMNEKIDGGTF